MAIAQAILGPLIWFGFIFNNLSLCPVFILYYLAVKLFLGGRNNLYSIPALSCSALASELFQTVNKSMV